MLCFVLLVEPTGQGGTPTVVEIVAAFAKIVATALRTVEALVSLPKDGHHPAPVAANALVDRAGEDAGIPAGVTCFPRCNCSVLHLLGPGLVLLRKLPLDVLVELKMHLRGNSRV